MTNIKTDNLPKDRCDVIDDCDDKDLRIYEINHESNHEFKGSTGPTKLILKK